jgi:hypothetical protein
MQLLDVHEIVAGTCHIAFSGRKFFGRIRLGLYEAPDRSHRYSHYPYHGDGAEEDRSQTPWVRSPPKGKRSTVIFIIPMPGESQEQALAPDCGR